MSKSLLDQLMASQQLIIAMLSVVPEDAAARVGAWDRRDIAGHLTATERDCYEPRIRAIAAAERPEFGFFSNDGADFGDIDLEAALADWRATRARIADFVSGLSDAQRRLTGRHETYGELTVSRYLEIALEHDHEHLRDLERLAGARIRWPLASA